MTYYLLCILYLDYGNDVQVQNRRKAAETTHNINNAFGPGTANECPVQWWFKKFCKEDETLEDKELSSWPFKIDNDQLRAIIKADLLTTT